MVRVRVDLVAVQGSILNLDPLVGAATVDDEAARGSQLTIAAYRIVLSLLSFGVGLRDEQGKGREDGSVHGCVVSVEQLPPSGPGDRPFIGRSTPLSELRFGQPPNSCQIPKGLLEGSQGTKRVHLHHHLWK